jgi:MoaA/NifB/PqqE/SkfB family radical SAM enzyme
MSYFRPEWTCGRYNQKHQVALMYNLIEGVSFFFEDESALIVRMILSHPRNTEIDLKNILLHCKIEATLILDFLEELYSVGLLSKQVPTAQIANNYRVEFAKNKNFNSMIDKESEFVSEAESDYNNAIKEDSLCNAVIELTYKCSAQCIHCYNPGASRNNTEKDNRTIINELNLSEYKKVIDELYELGCYKVTLTGGDPFSKPIIWDIIQYLYYKDIAFDIYTNGIYLEKEVQQLIIYYPRTVSISLYSGIEKDHERITRVKGSFRKTLSTIEQLSNYGVPLILKCCIMKPNIKSYYLVENIAKKNSAVVQFEVALQDSLDGDHCVSTFLQLPQAILEIVLRDKRIPLYVGAEKENYGAIKRNAYDRTCHAGETGLCITPNGNVQFCVTFPWILGNIKEVTLKRILTENIYLKKWKKTTLSDFENCGKEEYCQYCTICAGCNFVATGSPLKACKNSCYIAKCRYEVAEKLKKGNDPLKNRDVIDCLSECDNSISFLKRVIHKG